MQRCGRRERAGGTRCPIHPAVLLIAVGACGGGLGDLPPAEAVLHWTVLYAHLLRIEHGAAVARLEAGRAAGGRDGVTPDAQALHARLVVVHAHLYTGDEGVLAIRPRV